MLRKYLTLIFALSAISLPCHGKVWIQPLYYSDQQQTIGSMQGYSSYTGGLLFGGDKEVFDDITLGIGASYFNVTQKYFNYPNEHIDLQNYMAFLYGTVNLKQNAQVDWLVNGGSNNYKQRYVLTENTIASAEYNGQQYMGRIIGSKNYQSNLIKFIPQINANILYLHTDSYLENGSGLQNAANNDGTFTLGMGFKMSTVYSKTKFNVIPEVRCLLFYDVFTSGINTLTAFVIGGPALSTTASPGRAGGQFGTSLTAFIHNNVTCCLSYDLLLKNVYFNNVVSLTFNYLL